MIQGSAGAKARTIGVVVTGVALVAAGLAGRLLAPSSSTAPPAASPTPTVASPTPGASAIGPAGIVASCTPRLTPLVNPMPHADAPLRALPISTVVPSVAWLGAVTDRDGSIWLRTRGRLVHLDRATLDPTAAWSFADDPGFASSGFAPAAGGGVWLWDDRSLRRFDGHVFADRIALPTGMRLGSVAETPDGAVWAVDRSGRESGSDLLRWDGLTWTAVAPCDPADHLFDATLLIDPEGRLLAVELVGGRVRIHRWDGATWTIAEGMAGYASGLALASPRVAVDPVGNVYVATGDGIGRWDGMTWRAARAAASDVAVTDDGSVLAISMSPAGDAVVSTLDPVTVAARGAQTDIPGAVPVSGFVPVDAGALVVSVAYGGSGLAVVAPGGSPPRPVDAGIGVLAGKADHPGAPVLAVSTDEAWFGSWFGIAWRLRSGALDPVSVGGAGLPRVRAFARGADGTIWIGHDQGLEVARPPDFLPTAGPVTARTAISIAPLGDGRVRLLTADGSTYLATAGAPGRSASGIVSTGRIPFDWGAELAVTSDGVAWASGGMNAPDGNVNLVRLARRSASDTTWHAVALPDRSDSVVALAADPRGGLLVVLWRQGGAFRLVRYAGGRWGSAETIPMAGVTDVAAGSDGSVWIAGAALMRRTPAGTWDTVSPDDGLGDDGPGFYAPSVAPDGTLFVVCPSGICRSR